jgi:enoyl-CoA hydratase
MSGRVTITVQDHVAELTLTCPNLLNRFDAELHEEFPHALPRLRATPGVRAVVLSAEGKVFSAGGDTELMRSINDDVVERTRSIDHGGAILAALTDLPVPVVAAVHGHAIGLGASVVLGRDAVVSAPGVKIYDPHVLMGLAAHDGGCLVWPQAAGMLRARRYLITGDPVLAQDGYLMGIVTDLVDTPDDVLPAARALATRIAALPPLAVQATKRSLNAITRHRAAETVDTGFALGVEAIASADLLEATAAFHEKRPGQYEGR